MYSRHRSALGTFLVEALPFDVVSSFLLRRLTTVPYLQLGPGEFASKDSRSYSLRRDHVFGEKAVVKTNVAIKTKEACKKGVVGVVLCLCPVFHCTILVLLPAGLDKQAHLKPAGQPAEFREVAALTALRQTSSGGFRGLGGMWAGSLLQEGHLFKRKSDGSVFLSLGFVNQAFIMWKVDEISEAWSRIGL